MDGVPTFYAFYKLMNFISEIFVGCLAAGFRWSIRAADVKSSARVPWPNGELSR